MMTNHYKHRHHNFNLRYREGSDANVITSLVSGVLFQSTLPRRQRPLFYFAPAQCRNFNLRYREGSDLIALACD